MFVRSSDADLRKLKVYDRIAVFLFRRLTVGLTPATMPKEIPFNLDDVRAAMQDCAAAGLIDNIVKNVADIKYVYDARHDMPAEMTQSGPLTWLQDGKGRYKLRKTKRRNIIDLSDLTATVPSIEPVLDQVPPFISGLLGSDEQATFTRVRHANLISQFLGFNAWAIQGHHRTTLTYGQVEIDEVQAGLDGTVGTLVPISGKGGQDKLSWSQALNLNTYGRDKAPTAGMKVRSLGLWRDAAEVVWIAEFSPETDIDAIEIVKVRRFKFQ